MNEALSEARKVMVLAISSGLPTRLSGTVAARPAFFFGSSGKAIQHPSLDWTWGDHINPCPRCGGFERSRLREALDRMLARCIYGRASGANMTVGRRHIDDASASLGEHHAQLMLHTEQRAQDVCVEGRGVGFRGLLRHRAWLTFRSCAIDSNVKVAKAGDGLIDQVLHVVFVPDVGMNKNRLRAKLS
jgi:hypothetical protein